MNVPIPVQAFVMVFAAAAGVLVILGLGAVLFRSIAVLARLFTEASHWLINGLTRGVYELGGRAANTASFVVTADVTPAVKKFEPPRHGERLLLLLLSKDERANIPGDLEEEFKQIAAKHGVRYAKLWYYKQVAASAWPMMRKAVGWGLLASVGAWIRRSF